MSLLYNYRIYHAPPYCNLQGYHSRSEHLRTELITKKLHFFQAQDTFLHCQSHNPLHGHILPNHPGLLPAIRQWGEGKQGTLNEF